MHEFFSTCCAGRKFTLEVANCIISDYYANGKKELNTSFLYWSQGICWRGIYAQGLFWNLEMYKKNIEQFYCIWNEYGLEYRLPLSVEPFFFLFFFFNQEWSPIDGLDQEFDSCYLPCTGSCWYNLCRLVIEPKYCWNNICSLKIVEALIILLYWWNKYGLECR